MRAARDRLLDAYARRALFAIGEGTVPDEATVRLARKLDRLRRDCPDWWCAVDDVARIKRDRRRALAGRTSP